MVCSAKVEISPRTLWSFRQISLRDRKTYHLIEFKKKHDDFCHIVHSQVGLCLTPFSTASRWPLAFYVHRWAYLVRKEKQWQTTYELGWWSEENCWLRIDKTGDYLRQTYVQSLNARRLMEKLLFHSKLIFRNLYFCFCYKTKYCALNINKKMHPIFILVFHIVRILTIQCISSINQYRSLRPSSKSINSVLVLSLSSYY